MSKYNTGGKHSGDGGQTWGGSSIDVGAASTGTTANQPNVKLDAKPGGASSSGTKSNSS